MTALHKHCTAKLVVKTGGKLPRMSRISRATFSRINGNSAKRLGLVGDGSDTASPGNTK